MNEGEENRVEPYFGRETVTIGTHHWASLHWHSCTSSYTVASAQPALFSNAVIRSNSSNWFSETHTIYDRYKPYCTLTNIIGQMWIAQCTRESRIYLLPLLYEVVAWRTRTARASLDGGNHTGGARCRQRWVAIIVGCHHRRHYWLHGDAAHLGQRTTPFLFLLIFWWWFRCRWRMLQTSAHGCDEFYAKQYLQIHIILIIFRLARDDRGRHTIFTRSSGTFETALWRGLCAASSFQIRHIHQRPVHIVCSRCDQCILRSL